MIFTKCFMHVAYDRGSVLFRQGDGILREGAILGVYFPSDKALYSGMNFVIKDRFRLNSIICRKVGQK